MKKVLFISHDASRTGAPLALLGLLKTFSSTNVDIVFDILCLTGGELLPEFRSLGCNVYVIERKQNIFIKVLNRIFPKLEERWLFNKIAKQKYSLLYANTIATMKLAVKLRYILNISSILHVHELKYAIDVLAGKEYVTKNINSFEKVICVSKLAKKQLIDIYGVANEKLNIIYPFSEFVLTEIPTKQSNKSTNSFIVGFSGNPQWRKGTDILSLLVECFYKKYPNTNCIFKWIGFPNEDSKQQLCFDLDLLGISDLVILENKKEEPLREYLVFDIFVSLSREESFSLVCVENALLGNPILCFEGVIGATEVIGENGCIRVPYLQLEDMADNIYMLYKDKNMREQIGNNARKNILENYSKEKSIARIVEVIEELL